MSNTVHIAAIQSSFVEDRDENIAKIDAFIREAKAAGAQIILMPELFEGLYFPQTQDEEDFARALPAASHSTLKHYQALRG